MKVKLKVGDYVIVPHVIGSPVGRVKAIENCNSIFLDIWIKGKKLSYLCSDLGLIKITKKENPEYFI